ncbi:zinc finger BED domain-containing protein 1-like [Diachasma alloeum]|uniref:zinc finger BED domain-containing protein 1-like n=1 Tax=Diachasma alloeum TaxID=454923 RepID=UPI0007383C2E|nr:zinc finger BED domain-containing protein 1-like [Diachasma alloeum]
MKITQNKSDAVDFCMELIRDGSITLDDGRIDQIDMSTNCGINYVEICNYANEDDLEDDAAHVNISDEQHIPASKVQKDTNVQAQPSTSKNSSVEPSNDKRDELLFNTSSHQQHPKTPENYAIKLQRFKFSGNDLSKLSKESGAECRLCLNEIKNHGNTTNLMRHLTNHHNNADINALNALARTRKQKEVNNNKTTDNSDKSKQSPERPSSRAEHQQQEFDSASGPSNNMNYLPENPLTQPRIDKTFGKITAFKEGGAQAAKIKNAMVYMMAKDDLPLSATEKEGFRYLMSVVAPNYEVPKKTSITRATEEKYKVLSGIVKSKLAKVENLTLTTDIWTETMSTRGFLGLTIHFLENGKMSYIELDTIELDENRKAPYLSKMFEEFLLKWNISKDKITTVVTDGGTNIVKAVKDTFGEHKHITCFAHKLNVAISNVITANKALSSIVTKTKEILTYCKRSTTAADELRKAQDDDNTLRLVQDVPTRWNSTFYMLCRFEKLSATVSSILLKLRGSPPMLDSDEMAIVRDAINVLRHAETLTKEFSGAKYATTSRVIPAMFCFRECLAVVQNETSMGKSLQKELMAELDKKFSDLDKLPFLTITILLDPRYKRMYFPSPLMCSSLLRTVHSMISAETNAPEDESITNDESEATNSSDDLWTHHRDRILHQKRYAQEASSDDLNIDMMQFLNKPNLMNIDPINFWMHHKENTPALGRIVLKYLSTVATSVPCERLFSLASNIITEKRNRLLQRSGQTEPSAPADQRDLDDYFVDLTRNVPPIATPKQHGASQRRLSFHKDSPGMSDLKDKEQKDNVANSAPHFRTIPLEPPEKKQKVT